MINSKFKYIFLTGWIVFLTGMPLFSFAQHQVLEHTSSRNILIGDQVNVWLTYRQKGTKMPHIQWPLTSDSATKLTWVSKGKIDTLKTKDSLILSQKLTVTGFDSGIYYIPSFSFIIDSQQINTKQLAVHIKTINIDTTKAFKPIKGVQSMSITWLDYFYQYWPIIVLCFVALLIIIALILLYFLVWRKRKKHKVEKVPPEKAHEKALRLLAELEEKKLWQSGEIKRYYEQLSQIIRSYLENRFGITALERTTGELLKETHNMRILKPFRKQLREILRTADMAKFARATPLKEEHESCMNAAREIITKTKMTSEERNQ